MSYSAQDSKSTIKHIAKLAQIPVDEVEAQKRSDEFEQTMEVVNQITSVETRNIEPTHQVTGLQNVFRDDVVDTERMFSQKLALQNAAQSHKGYFVVPRILEESN
jgi:aspartyl-tRNA(Asn)/glutamyl-tRNA(Gln) amidotransferase subunit C